jgi:putative phosphoribosyl transferase
MYRSSSHSTILEGMLFSDRRGAGRALASALSSFASSDVVTVGLPRGGVPVAFEVAQELHTPLDVVVVRKLGVPNHPELAMGAVGEGSARVVNDDVVRMARVSPDALDAVERRERDEVARRAKEFRGDWPRAPLDGRTVIVVDDGIATGSTARVACMLVRAQGAARVVLAAPVAPAGIETLLRPEADDVVCLLTPGDFSAVGQFYLDFSQVADAEVTRLLQRASEHGGGSGI